ncbi:MAG: YraN family protein [Pirellulaceae bacterium]
MIGSWWNLFRRSKSTLGERGEAVAAKFLQRKGYTILARSDRTVMGELDLIVVRDRVVIFVEVKTRRRCDKGSPAEAVDAEKQQRIIKLALAYLRRHQLIGCCSSRFDVISIVWPDDSAKPQITHFENAFQPNDQRQIYS